MSSEHMTLGVAHSGQGAPLTRAVGALLRALASSRRARSYSLFSDSSFTAASQISSLLGLACRGTAASAMSGARAPLVGSSQSRNWAVLCYALQHDSLMQHVLDQLATKPQDVDFLMNKPACHTGTDVWQLQHLGRAASHHPLPAAKVYSCLTYMDPPTQSCLLPSLGTRNWPPSVLVWEGQKDARVITDYAGRIPRVGTRLRTTQSPADIWAVTSSLLKAQSPAGHTQPDHVPKPEKQPHRDR